MPRLRTRHWPRSTIRNCSVVSFVGRIAGRATPGPAYNATERAGEPDRSRRRSGSLPGDGLSGCRAIHSHGVRDALFNEQVWDDLKRQRFHLAEDLEVAMAWMGGFEASMVPRVGIETDGESCESEFEEPYRRSGQKTGTKRSVLAAAAAYKFEKGRDMRRRELPRDVTSSRSVNGPRSGQDRAGDRSKDVGVCANIR